MEIIDLAGRPELAPRAAEWFASKWGIPAEEYLASMEQSARGGAFPRWYLALDGAGIAGGCGVIENDFHDRRDLAPNLCALFVEPERRGRGLAGELLAFACRDMAARGVGTLYLITEHDSFYERYGWQYLCTAQPDDGGAPLRLYCRPTSI